MPTEQSGRTAGADRRWAKAFPLATDASGADRDIEETGGDAWRTLATRAAATARWFDSVPLKEHFPLTRDDDTEVEVLRLDTRSSNALAREGIWTVGELAERSAREVASIRQAGQRTVRTITNKLAWLNAERALGIGPIPNIPVLPDSADAVSEVLDPSMTEALRVIAGWHVLRGQPDSSLWSDSGLDGAPVRILEAWTQLQELRAENVMGADAPSPAAVLDELLSQEESRNVQILIRRLFADEPETLDAIGQDLDLTRERVRQIAGRAASRLQSEVTENHEGLADLGAALRQRIGVVGSVDRVLDVYPSLIEIVPVVGQPAWRVIDRLDDSFEIRDGWAAVPTVSDAARRTQEEIRKNTDLSGTASLVEVARAIGLYPEERAEEFLRWLDFLEMPYFKDRIVAEATSIPDWAVIVLAHEAKPLSAAEIGELIPVTRSESSIRNALATDERITRVDRRLFALASWGMEEYGGIRQLIGRHLDANGGSADLEALVADLTEKFDVAERSVRTYASSFPYEMHEGQVTRQDVQAQAREGNLGAARRAYATPEGVAFRFEVSAEHWRGSGSVIPSDLARSIGLSEGQSWTLSCKQGDQTIYWTGLQPSLGSVKRLVEQLGAEPGEWVMAEFGIDGSFSLRKLDFADRSGVALAQIMTGTESVPPGDAEAAIAVAFSLPKESGWASVIAAARDRGEDDLVAALMSDPAVDAGIDIDSGSSTTSAASVTVEDIMDLL